MLNMIETLEKRYRVRVLYLSLYGSYLFGTSDRQSDKDYKGVFVSDREDLLLKRDLDFINANTNKADIKNTSEDVDVHLDSLHTWLGLLKKGETGAVDLLFSIWDEASTVYIDAAFKQRIRDGYLKLISKNPKAFVGYGVAQSRKYNVKGERYLELTALQAFMKARIEEKDAKIGGASYREALGALIENEGFRYIRHVVADGPRAGGVITRMEYLEVLGKKFSPTATAAYVLDKIDAMEADFGSRAKSAADGVDWKALSHALRVILEVEELLSASFITFPLKERAFIYAVKKGKIPFKEVIAMLEAKIKIIDALAETTPLAEKQDGAFVEALLLTYYG